MSTITVTNPIYDGIYRIQAWEDNNFALKLVQGEGIAVEDGASSTSASNVKAPRFQLCDRRGTVDLTSALDVYWTVKLPDGQGEDSLACNVVTDANAVITAADGIIEIPIVNSVTEFAGEVYGEIQVRLSNGVVKFHGINACVFEGLPDDVIERSSRFTALDAALNKIAQLTPEGTVDIETLKPSFVNLNYAHEVSSESYADGGVYVDDATDYRARYIYMNSSNMGVGLLRCVSVKDNANVSGVLQILETYYGGMFYRLGSAKSAGGTRTWQPAPYQSGAPNWYSIEGTKHKDTSSLSNDDSHYPSSKLVKTITDALSAAIAGKADATDVAAIEALLDTKADEADVSALETTVGGKVDKITTIAGIPLQSNVDATALMNELLNTGKTINYHYKPDNSDPLGGIAVNITVPAIWNSSGTIYFLWGKTQGTALYTYTGSIISTSRILDDYTEFNPSATIGKRGEIVIGGTANGVWVCKGGNRWISLVESYTKAEVDTLLSGKAEASAVYSKAEIDNKLSAVVEYEWIDFDDDPSAIDDLMSDSTLYNVTSSNGNFDLVNIFNDNVTRQSQVKITEGGRLFSRYRTRELSGFGYTEWSVYSDWVEAYVDNAALDTKQDIIKYERPRVAFSSVGEIPYTVGDLFYFNRKMYRYTGYTYVGTYYRANFTTDGVSAVTMPSSPTSTETIANYGINTYDAGDLHVRKRSSDTKARNIYICTNVTSQASGTSLVYTYVWEELTIKADTISGYGITDAYTKSEIDEMLANLIN